MNSDHNRDNPDDSNPLGEPLGRISTVSESMQSLVCVGGVIGGMALVCLLDIPILFAIPAICVAIVLPYLVMLRMKKFSTRIDLFENGIRLWLKGEEQEFLFDDIQEIRVEQSDHSSIVAGNKVYLGSLAKFELVLEDRIRPIRFELESRKGKTSHETVQAIIDQTSNAVQWRMSKLLEEESCIPMGTGVELMMDGLVVHGKTIPLDELGRIEPKGNEIGLVRRDEALPFANLNTGATNFWPAFTLMVRMRQAILECPVF